MLFFLVKLFTKKLIRDRRTTGFRALRENFNGSFKALCDLGVNGALRQTLKPHPREYIMIVLNLKTYDRTLEKAGFFAEAAADVMKETGVRIIVCPPAPFLKESVAKFPEVFAQHTDAEAPGAFTGTTPAEALKRIGVKGSLVNHSERKIRPLDKVKTIVERLRQNSLESIVCAESSSESAKIAAFSPSFIAVEPPELIGSGISVSNAKPEIVTNTISAVAKVNPKVPVLCGAGVSNPTDVKNALKLGAKGVLLASAFVKAPDPREFLRGFAAEF
jgi:triosephosphate isomerase